MQNLETKKDITIKVENSQLLVSSLEIAENFGKNHRDVIRSIKNTIDSSAQKCAQLFYEATYTSKNNREVPMYYMNRDGFSLLAMGFTGKKALEWKLKYIKAFNEMEQKLSNVKDSYMIEDPIKRAKRWIEEEEERQKLIAENEKLKPKALFTDAVSASKGSVTIGALAKMLIKNGVDIGQNRLYSWMRENGYLIKNGRNKNVATQRYVERGLFELKENLTFDANGEPVIRKPTTMVTGKGQKYFIDMFLKGLKF